MKSEQEGSAAARAANTYWLQEWEFVYTCDRQRDLIERNGTRNPFELIAAAL
jgi:hypothetical protein